jgi:aryl-alcohol dehydrogenase-like predicted oxidoreductase
MKIALGTVQFGLDYGVSNIYGKTSKHEASQILQYAHNSGIEMLDTAMLYGNSENIISYYSKSNHNWKVVTKTPQFIGNSINAIHVKQLKKSFEQSLINLNKNNVYGLLLHSCDDLLKPNGHLLFKEMERLKSIGMVKKIGVSLYSDEQINAVINKFNIDLVQLPVNILSQKLFLDGWLKKLKDSDIEIHARSVFLQGLLLMKRSLVPSYFSPIKKKLDKFYRLSKVLGLTQLELSLGFVMNIDEVDKVVVGANTIGQLQEIIQASQTRLQLSDYRDISIDNNKYTNPSSWKI